MVHLGGCATVLQGKCASFVAACPCPSDVSTSALWLIGSFKMFQEALVILVMNHALAADLLLQFVADAGTLQQLGECCNQSQSTLSAAGQGHWRPALWQDKVGPLLPLST